MSYSLEHSIALGTLFKKSELDWESGDYGHANFKLNDALRPIFGAQVFTSLEKTYSMNCLQLIYTPLLGRVYVPTGRSMAASLVYAPSGIDQGESPVVLIRYGKGFVGYTGDYGNEQGSQALIVAMLGKPPIPFVSLLNQ